MPFEIQSKLQPQEVLQKITSETIQGRYHWRAWWPAGRGGKSFHSHVSGNSFEIRKLPGGLGFSTNSMVDNVSLKGTVTAASGGSKIVADAGLTPWSSVSTWGSIVVMIALAAFLVSRGSGNYPGQSWLIVALFGIASVVSFGMGMIFKHNVEKLLQEFAEKLLADSRQR